MKTYLPFGITIVPNKGRYEGLKMAWLRSYGIPMDFATLEEADTYIQTQMRGFTELMPRIEPISRCLLLVRNIVECNSGNKTLVRDERGVPRIVPHQDWRPTYDQLIEGIELRDRLHKEFLAFLRRRSEEAAEAKRIAGKRAANRASGGISFKLKKPNS